MKSPVVGMTSHTWVRADGVVLTTSPPHYNWVCTKCGEKVTRPLGRLDTTSPCPERVARLENQRYM